MRLDLKVSRSGVCIAAAAVTTLIAAALDICCRQKMHFYSTQDETQEAPEFTGNCNALSAG